MNKIALVPLLSLLISCGNNETETKVEVAQASNATTEPTMVVAVGKVEPENEIINLSASAGGIVKSVFKRDGDVVRQGEQLIQLDDDLEQSRANEIRLQVQTQRAQIEVAQLQLNEARINLENKSNLLTRTKRLVESGAETKQVFDDLASETKVLESTVERSKANVALATGKLNELLAQLETAELEVQKKRFKAPADGVVLDMQLSTGESVTQFSTYAEFAPNGKLIVRAEVDELFSDRVKTGQKVDIVFTGSSKVLATGEIVRVSPYLKKKSLMSEKASDQEDRRVREVHVALSNGGSLLINSKVECIINL